MSADGPCEGPVCESWDTRRPLRRKPKPGMGEKG